MAKKQTFTSKLGKDEKSFKFVKHIKTVTSEQSGHIKFIANMVRLEEAENIDQALKRMEEETPAEEIPAEETQEEASTEEETPVEDAPTEEAPAEEEIPVEESFESVPEEDSAKQADESSKE